MKASNMKKILSTTLIFIVALSLFSCQAGPYPFKISEAEIESIEIVSAESSLDFTVVKTLSEDKEEDFLKRFQEIKFSKYFGDPTKIYGNAVKINYKDGSYEMICNYTAEYVKDGTVYFLFRSCQEEEKFDNLINEFSEE